MVGTGASLIALAAALHAAPARAADAEAEGVTVTARDPAGLLERRSSDTVFGLGKPLIETPRSASFVSDLTLERYGVQTIDDLIQVSPGSFTDSYYGVAGALNLRGTLAETYFRGFKRVENRGTYPTPIGAAEQVEIVRGPPTPIYGPGKVGGFLNISPKTAKVRSGYLTEPTGEAEGTLGAYGQKRLTGRVGLPIRFGTTDGGLYAYAEAEGGGSYYRGIDPAHQLVQLSVDLDIGSGWSLAFGGQGYRSTGAVQTPGWNRITQALIDSGTYVTGRDTTLVDADGNGRLTPNEVGAGGLIAGYFGFKPGLDPRFTLDTGVGTTKLDRRTVFVSPRDFSDTSTVTLYGDLARDLLDAGTVKLQLFYDQLSNQRFVSYGFPADYRSEVFEARGSWTVDHAFGPVKTRNVLGAAWRYASSLQKESFNGGNLSLDRRDLAFGATATDILDDAFSLESGGLTWETAVRSRWRDTGLFAVTDATLGRWNLVLGGRYDRYRVASRDDGTVVFGVPNKLVEAGKGSWTYSASLSFKAPFGLMPYVTFAKDAALELGQAGGVPPNLVQQGGWLSKSTLSEGGIKAQGLDGSLVASLSAYRQTRTQLGQNNVVVGTIGKGVELELRWLATKNLSFTFAGNRQTTRMRGPDNSFTVIPPSAVGLTGQQGYGGAYAVYSFAQLRPGDYTNTLIPKSVASLFAVYTTDKMAWGRAGATLGATRVSSMASTLPGIFVLPSYTRADASAFVEHGAWRLSVNVDNLTDKAFFTPIADVYANVAVLPGVGRTWRMSLRRQF